MGVCRAWQSRKHTMAGQQCTLTGNPGLVEELFTNSLGRRMQEASVPSWRLFPCFMKASEREGTTISSPRLSVPLPVAIT